MAEKLAAKKGAGKQTAAEKKLTKDLDQAREAVKAVAEGVKEEQEQPVEQSSEEGIAAALRELYEARAALEELTGKMSNQLQILEVRMATVERLTNNIQTDFGKMGLDVAQCERRLSELDGKPERPEPVEVKIEGIQGSRLTRMLGQVKTGQQPE